MRGLKQPLRRICLPKKIKLPIRYSNQDTARLFEYHARTKHTYASVHYNTHYLDWDNQPNPFRIYSDVPVIPLPRKPDFPNMGTLKTLEQLVESPKKNTSPKLTIHSISQLLYYSMAISAWKQVRDSDFKYSLRVNPSSGNLHPTETHLALKGIEGVPDGLYHYRVNEHALEQRGIGDFVKPLAQLADAPWAMEAPILIILTSIFWRESWKYQNRAYRYCLHDLGHACGSILTSAQTLELPGTSLGHFPDIALAKVLDILETDERPLILIPLGVVPTENGIKENYSVDEILSKTPPVHGKPNQLSQEELSYSLIEEMHSSTLLPDNIIPCPSPPKKEKPLENTISLPHSFVSDKPLKIVSRIRRSALEFNPEIPMSLEDFSSILYSATRGFRADFRNNVFGGRGSDFITLYLYIHNVNEIERGAYQYNPQGHCLKKIKDGDQRAWAAGLSLGQSIAANCVVAFSMIANLQHAAEIFGNRGYRYVHTEAGFIGQGLYLASEALGYNSTGIGAFFDEDVHKYLGLSTDQGQVVYHFSIGKAVLDDRLIQIGEDPLDGFATPKP